MTLHYQIKVLITSRVFLHAILNYGMKPKASSNFQSMIFRWYRIILSILRDWKTIMKKVHSEYFAHTGSNDTCNVLKEQLMSIHTIRTKQFYDLLISKIFKQPSSQKIIVRKLNVEISNWKEIYTHPRKITHDSYSRIFQYKIINNILHLNKHLHQFKIVSTPLCSLCSSVNETVFDLFGECLLKIKAVENSPKMEHNSRTSSVRS